MKQLLLGTILIALVSGCHTTRDAGRPGDVTYVETIEATPDEVVYVETEEKKPAERAVRSKAHLNMHSLFSN
jgi:hypothetical protein